LKASYASEYQDLISPYIFIVAHAHDAPTDYRNLTGQQKISIWMMRWGKIGLHLDRIQHTPPRLDISIDDLIANIAGIGDIPASQDDALIPAMQPCFVM